METTMPPRFAPALGYATIFAAVASASALIHGKAYAESPTIDTTPFVSTRTRAEVQAEVMASPRASLGYAEYSLQGNDMQGVASGYTRAEATAAYRASREESKALTGEDSGSAYLAQRMSTQRPDAMVARASR
jgi:hypothetical protein